MNRANDKSLCEKRISVAPMMDWTDRACRNFHRVLSPSAWLYTEMVTTGALIHGDYNRYLVSDAAQQPVVLQLGGSEPQAMAYAAELGSAYGYSEININCGCPSERVQRGAFGACLMKEASLVAQSITAMRQVSAVPITVKCRIGVDDVDSPQDLLDFTHKMMDAGCERIIIHARKAWLKGLSPKENREIPPLDYDRVLWIKAQMPNTAIEINGGFTTHDSVKGMIQQLDGVMIGREAYQNPWFLAELDGTNITRSDAIKRYTPIAMAMMDEGTPLRTVLRPMIGLYNGLAGARQWRRALSEMPQIDGITLEEVLHNAQTMQQKQQKQSAIAA